MLHPAHDNVDEAHHAPPSRELATQKLTLGDWRACDRFESVPLEWLAQVLRVGRPGVRMIPIAPHLIKPLHTETLHANTHRHTHHHHGPDVHHDHKDSDHHSHDAMDSEHHEHLLRSFSSSRGEGTGGMHDDHPHNSSHSPLLRTEPKPDSACGTEVPLLSRKLRASAAVAVQALLSVITDDGHDMDDSDDMGADLPDISFVAAILRDAEQLRRESGKPPQLPTRRRAGQLAAQKVLQQRRTDLDATQIERQRHDFERRLTPTPDTLNYQLFPGLTRCDPCTLKPAASTPEPFDLNSEPSITCPRSKLGPSPLKPEA